MFKQDTSFIKRNPYVEFAYTEKGSSNFKFFYELEDSRTIGNVPISVGTIPDFANVKTSYYGLGVSQNWLDDFFFPKNGLAWDVSGSIGNKKLLDFALSESLEKTSIEIKSEASIEYYKRIKSGLGIYSGLFGAYMQNDNLFLNELFRLGGINSLRGFQENRFYASEYILGKVEGRFYLEEKSYLLAFVDYGFYNTKISGSKPAHNGAPMGAGVGLTLSTNTGIFSFVYAVGREGSNPLIFSNSVVNFGLTTTF